MADSTQTGNNSETPKASQEVPQLVISTRIKDIFHANDINTSGDFLDAINQHLIEVCQRAIARCKGNGRKTARPVDL